MLFTIKTQARYNFAAEHLNAASYFVTELKEIEKAASKDIFAPIPFNYYWRSAIISAGCAIEAYIYDLLNGFVDGAYTAENADQKEQIAKMLERQRMFDKFEFIYLYKTGIKIEQGTEEYENVKLLINLRNEIVHYKTHWLDDSANTERLAQKLRAKFKTNQFKCRELFFPDLCTSSSSAEWALNSAKEFIEWYARGLNGVNPVKHI
ncbi:hypothetical protein [Vibrio cholerae]|uniref:hypothetical protein n=1 Tax=Vibrio cholerae TaxID=666 RepID=UPI00285DD997|nr:hypothetical protein [Vibrio cholerae]ELE5868261.1 hypothetical protein [Vibrio cholerae]ELG7084206.1 hypothetical protein [Vibrio cholerae]